MRTIPRNHTKVIADIKKRATKCTVYNEHNDFTGTIVDPAVAWEALAEYTFARLIQYDTKWTVHVHMNRWFELKEENDE